MAEPDFAGGGSRGRRNTNKDSVGLYVSFGTDNNVDSDLLHELFTQAGPVKEVYIPVDKNTDAPAGYGFVEMESMLDAQYAIRVLNMVKLYGKPLTVRLSRKGGDNEGPTGGSKGPDPQDVGANLVVRNLDPSVDAKTLYDAFSAFGFLINGPTVLESRKKEHTLAGLDKLKKDSDETVHPNHAFLSYDNFASSDAAVAALNGQYLANRPMYVGYARKRNDPTQTHGDAVDRHMAAQLLAERVQLHAQAGIPGSGNAEDYALLLQPHTMFADGPPDLRQSTIASTTVPASSYRH
eukprot:Clim_evm6s215 gene=Clim_evmTU6s215